MKKKSLHTITLIFAVFALFACGTGYAQGTLQPKVTSKQVRTLVTRIGSETTAFKLLMQRAVDRSGVSDTNGSDSIMDQIRELETSNQTLRSTVNARRAIDNEVSDVLDSALPIDGFMKSNPMNGRTGSQWVVLRNDLNTLARYYQISWNWNQQVVTPSSNGTYAATESQVRDLIALIESKTDDYQRQINSTSRNYPRSDSSELSSYITQFIEATDRLKERFYDHQSTSADASEVLTRAQFIDRSMTGNRMDSESLRQWTSLRTDLNTLASYFRVSTNWNRVPPVNTGNTYSNTGIDARITGTYRLNTSRSENVADVLDRTMNVYNPDQRDNMRTNLERRLASPEMIAVEKVGRSVTIASTNLPQVRFEVDGAPKTELNPRGRTITTTTKSDSNGITINYEGDQVNDFFVTFSPGANGVLNVTRRIYLENRNETVTVASVYDKVNNSAQWSTVNGGMTGTTNDFFIPNGTRITTAMRGTVKTGASQVGDRFQMEITSPSQYSGAVIEGRVTQSADSGRVSGRANITLEFDTVTMNGRTYRFAGIIDGVTAANGDSITVNNEGTVRDSSQTTTTATRAGIGAVLGAIIGAIAGGGQGAAIGAGVGAGAGAGSVLITGRDTIELGPGSMFNITATAPANTGVVR